MSADAELDPRHSAALGEPFVTEVLRSLVQTRSVNPGTPESGVADVIKGWLDPLGMEVELVEFAEGRTSVGARMRGGAGDGPAVILNGHTDTVPIDDATRWDFDPFGGEVHEGNLYGRGSCDMKAGLAVQIAVAHALAPVVDRLSGSLILHFAAGEERGEPGTLSLLEAGFTGDLGIVTEPTELNVATATRGAMFLRVRLRGRSIHASRARLGVNPIGQLRHVLGVIDEYDRELAGRSHPLLPGGSCTPTVVTGGVKENAVPDWCELLLDRRLLPSEDGNAEAAVLQERLDRLKADDPDLDVEVTAMFPPIEGAEVAPDSPLALRLLDVVRKTTGRTAVIYGSPFGSDVRNLVRDAGIEAVTFGPGSVEQAHAPNERVPIDQVSDASRVLTALLLEYFQFDQSGTTA
jgi:succinyl-diaminopimelate desuccinylase